MSDEGGVTRGDEDKITIVMKAQTVNPTEIKGQVKGPCRHRGTLFVDPRVYQNPMNAMEPVWMVMNQGENSRTIPDTPAQRDIEATVLLEDQDATPSMETKL